MPLDALPQLGLPFTAKDRSDLLKVTARRRRGLVIVMDEGGNDLCQEIAYVGPEGNAGWSVHRGADDGRLVIVRFDSAATNARCNTIGQALEIIRAGERETFNVAREARSAAVAAE